MMTSGICSNQKEVFVGGFPNIMNIYQNSLVTYFISPRLFLRAPSNSKARQVRSMITLMNAPLIRGQIFNQILFL